MTQYVVTTESDTSVFCIGIYNDLKKAIGKVMQDIWEFGDSYKDDGDTFEYSKPYELECDGGLGFCLEYKKREWEHMGKDYYYILFYEVDENEWAREMG